MNIHARNILRFLKTGSLETADYKKYRNFLNLHNYHYEKSYFNITIDFELAWSRSRRGNSSTTLEESLERARRVRECTPILFELAETYSIPITFATVGHVALKNCEEHANPPSFQPAWAGENWYNTDPCTDISNNKDYYGADLIEKILKSSVRHSIASHSFSHVDVADSETTDIVARFEIEESFRILKRIYPPLSTYIFVKNHPAHKNILKETGFSIYRDNTHCTVEHDEYGLTKFPLGLWVSAEIYTPGNITKLVDVAIARKQIINIWCHLYEFETGERFQAFFEPIFAHIDGAQKAHTIEALTMETIVSNVSVKNTLNKK